MADRRAPGSGWTGRGTGRFPVAAVDVPAGRVIGLLEFQTAVEEIFDVQLLPGARFPEVIGFQQETIQHTFVVPPAARGP